MAAINAFVRIRIQPVASGKIIRKSDGHILNKGLVHESLDIQIPVNDTANLDSLKQLLVAISQNQASSNSYNGIATDYAAST